MSIGHIENYPTQPPADAVEEVDPEHDPNVEVGPGVDTDETSYYGRARRHVDPLGTALLRLGVGRGRELDRHPGYEGLMARPGAADPDAPFRSRDQAAMTTGTEQRSDRWVHDEALQVRQLIPTGFSTNNYVLPTPAGGISPAVQVAWKRPERMTIVLYNFGAANAFIANSQAGLASTGFLLLSGSSLSLDVTAEIWAKSDPAGVSPATLYVMEQYRSDNAAS